MPRNGRLSTSANAGRTVQEEMEIVAGSSTHGEVSTREVSRNNGIPYSTVWVVLQRTLLSYPYKIERHHELLPGDCMKRRAFEV